MAKWMAVFGVVALLVRLIGGEDVFHSLTYWTGSLVIGSCLLASVYVGVNWLGALRDRYLKRV